MVQKLMARSKFAISWLPTEGTKAACSIPEQELLAYIPFSPPPSLSPLFKSLSVDRL